MSDALLSSTALPLIIRCSSLPDFNDCPRRWAVENVTLREEIKALGYEPGQRINPVGSATGTAFHAGAAQQLRGKMETGTLPPLSDAFDVAIASFRQELEKGVTWDSTTDTSNTAEKQIQRQLSTWRTHKAPEIEPLDVEVEMRAEAKPGFTVVGHADVCPDEKIIDHKSGRNQPQSVSQLGAYSLVRRSEGKPVNFLQVDWVPRVSLKKEQPPPVTYDLDVGAAERDAHKTLRTMIEDVREFRTKKIPEAFRANPSSMLCDAKWCSAWGTEFCRVHQGAKV